MHANVYSHTYKCKYDQANLYTHMYEYSVHTVEY